MKAIPTIYKNIQMRSRLEANTAEFFDALGIEWKYELTGFLNKGIHYLPDFYLPKLKTWVECKNPELLEKFKNKINLEFLKKDEDYLLLSNNKSYFYENSRWEMKWNESAIGLCKKCAQSFFFGWSGSFQCRFCQYSNGDHHLNLGESLIGSSNFGFLKYLFQEEKVYLEYLKSDDYKEALKNFQSSCRDKNNL